MECCLEMLWPEMGRVVEDLSGVNLMKVRVTWWDRDCLMVSMDFYYHYPYFQKDYWAKVHWGGNDHDCLKV